MNEDQKRPPPPGKGTDESKPLDWDTELPTWERAFPMGETTPVGGGEEEPPDPDEQLVLDDISGDVLPPRMDDAPGEQLDRHEAEVHGAEEREQSLVDLAVLRERDAPTPPGGVPYDESAEPTLISPSPGMMPTAPTRPEDDTSSLLIIPDVSELEAAAAQPRAWEKGTSSGRESERPASDLGDPAGEPRSWPEPPRDLGDVGRGLTADGLPDLSELFADPTPTLPLPGAPDWQTAEPAAGSDPFSEALPVEAAGSLDLQLPSRSWIWSPGALADEVSDRAASAPGLDTGYWRGQLAQALDELAAVERSPDASPALRARRAYSVGRLAERAGPEGEDPHRFYEKALAADPTFLPALRAQLRARLGGGALAEASQPLAALAQASPLEGPVYRELLAESRAVESVAGEQPEGAGGDRGSLAAALRAAERALRGDDPLPSGRALATLAARLTGQAAVALRLVAALYLERAGELEQAAQLRAAAGEGGARAGALAGMREVLRGAGTDAWRRLEAAADTLPSSPVRSALLRWSARELSASDAGVPGGGQLAADLLARARSDAPPEEADVAEQLELALATLEDVGRAPDDEAPVRPDVELDLALAPAWRTIAPELTALVLRRRWLRSPPTSVQTGLAWLEAARARAGQGEPGGDSSTGERSAAGQGVLFGILAEKLTGLEEGAARLPALASWARLDPARRAAAQRRAAALLLAGAPGGRAQASEAVAAAAQAAPGEASFWLLSWYQRGAGEPELASRGLREGVAAWETMGNGAAEIARALQDRAAGLDVAALPQRLLERLPVTSFAVGDRADEPGALLAELKGGVSDVRRVAERWKRAAAEGSPFRLLEAAGWLREAGAPGEALALLREGEARAKEHPHIALMQRRLVRLAGDAASAAVVLGDWLAAETDPVERAELEMLRAEALERSGAQREAAGIYRELLASPLLRDADLALRRALWSLRDGPALEELWRDEHDAMSGAGRSRQAAAALVEKARAARDLRGDLESAADELRAALEEDSTRQDARVMLLATSEGRIGRGGGLARLAEVARELSPHTSSLLYLAALLAEGQGPAEAELAERFLRESIERAGPIVPLALLRRQIVGEESRETPDPGRVTRFETTAASIGESPGSDRRLATALLLRAAELEDQAGDAGRAEALLDRARSVEPEHLPPLVRKLRLLLARGADGDAASLLAELGRVLRGPGRARALRAAAAMAFARMQDRPRAHTLLEEALTLDPGDPLAFTWLRRLLEGERDSAGLAALLARRAAVTTGAEAAALRLERADLLLGPLGDRAGARAELGAILEREPQHVGALARLAAIEQEEGNHGAAAALSIRQARFEREPAALRDCFLRIGRLHTGPLEDPKLALGAYERVLRIEPFHREALEALSELYARQAETRKALAVTERLVELETDRSRRLPFILKLATLWEAAGDARRAGVVYRRAVDELPRDLTAVGELARFHERQGDLGARNLLLDGSLALLREDLRRTPADLGTLRTLIPLLRWRQRRTTAVMASQLLARFTDSEPERQEALAFLASLRAEGASGGFRLAPLANPELDERALPANAQTGVRHLLRLLGPGLARASKPDLRRYHVGRGQRQGRGTPVREALTPVAADLGVRELDVYVSTEQPLVLAVEPGDPPALILGSQLVDMGSAALRFAGASALRLVETHFDLLARGGPDEAGALLAAVVRQFLPDFRPSQLDGAVLAAAEARVSRALGKGLRAELGPFASHIAGAFSPESFYLDALETGARAGLLACGDLATALEVIARMAGHATATPALVRELPLAARLSDFALSEDYEELSQALDAVS